MYFEERELKPYAEPVSTSELREGTTYFAVNYVPGDMLIPIMETLVFIGRNLDIGDVGKVYFQDVRSYRQGIRHDTDPSDEGYASDVNAEIFCGPENQVSHIFEYEQALDNLIKCSLRRMKLDTERLVRFEGRELKPYAEPTSVADLKQGSVYFAVTFVDEDMLIPVLETIVFVGRDLEPGDVGKVYFRNARSSPDAVDSENEWDYTAFENNINHVFEFEGALDQLLACSLRRRKE